MYEKIIKRGFDIILSLIAIVALVPVFAIVAAVIYIDDPGRVFFRQKRMGKDKKIFSIVKFRSMKVKTPNIPTYFLDNPEQYITRIGKIIRKWSIDELPQIYNIFLGHMSIVGPRPSQWNEDILIAERDKYGVNTIKPGLTGWAQINGRDELPIDVKAKFDAEYLQILNKGGFGAFFMDVKCIFGTVLKVFKHDNIVEGKPEWVQEMEKEAVNR